MKGEVALINRANMMVAVRVDDGAYSIFQVIEGEVHPKDVVEWGDHYTLGEARIRNRTTGRSVLVFFENHDVHQSILRQQLRA